MPRGNPTPIRSVRVPDDLWARVAAKAEREGRTLTDVLVAALKRYVAR